MIDTRPVTSSERSRSLQIHWDPYLGEKPQNPGISVEPMPSLDRNLGVRKACREGSQRFSVLSSGQAGATKGNLRPSAACRSPAAGKANTTPRTNRRPFGDSEDILRPTASCSSLQDQPGTLSRGGGRLGRARRFAQVVVQPAPRVGGGFREGRPRPA